MKYFTVILSIILLNSISLGQNIITSKDTLKYLQELKNSKDSIYIYNSGNEILTIDSMNNFNYTYNYLLTFIYKDSIEKSGYVGYYSEIFPTQNFYPMEIFPNDSAKFIFQYLPPVTKESTPYEVMKDSLYIYNNSQNLPIFILNIINDRPLNIDNELNQIYDYNLLHNYPNPFNPFTKIIYSLFKESNVVLEVFDMLGRSIQILINDFQNAGKYELVFDGTKLASGVYYYQLRVRNKIYTRKMLLIK